MGKITVLGIETSCDDTSVALLAGSDDLSEVPKLLGHKNFSGEHALKKWGGIVPEIAARNHQLKIPLLLKELIEESDLSLPQIDIIAITTHPGLLGPLLTGLNVAKTLSLMYKKPMVAVNHLLAHLEAIYLTKIVAYPYLGMIVSGGHGLFLLVTSPNERKIIGTTLDDAPGEAFDKGGKLMGLEYPAGREIDKLAKQGDANAFTFPIGMRNSQQPNMSFSGVKSSLRLFLEKNKNFHLPDLCASYQKAIVDALILKLQKAASIVGAMPIVVGGGVANNSSLRQALSQLPLDIHTVALPYCGDNGAMVANYALRAQATQLIPFPQCLELDAHSTFVNKKRACLV